LLATAAATAIATLTHARSLRCCRAATLALLFVPAVGWVAFNILQPFFNQMGRMQEMNEDATSGGKGKRRGVAAAAGLGAALAAMAADQADAAQEVMQLAGDNRWVVGRLLWR